MDIASYAPLCGSSVLHIQTYVRKHPSADESSFAEICERVTKKVVQAARDGELDTPWVCQELTRLSPQQGEVTRDVLWVWKKNKVLRYCKTAQGEHPAVHSVAALLIARHFHLGERRWNTSMAPSEPQFYCRIELAPGAPAHFVAYPFESECAYLVPAALACRETLLLVPPRPVDQEFPSSRQIETAGWYKIPPSALIYTPYRGVVLREDGTVDEEWLAVAGGAIRFFGEMGFDALAHWDQHIQRLDLEEKEIPDIMAAVKILALQLLARTRLSCKQDKISFQNVPSLAPDAEHQDAGDGKTGRKGRKAGPPSFTNQIG